MVNVKPKIWNLKPKAGRRFRQGHPWVFASDLAESPKGIEPGSTVEMRDERGEFLARGYGNAQSLIVFRALSRSEAQAEPWSANVLARKVVQAAQWRRELGLRPFSHRLVFGEGDDLPGLVIDRFLSRELGCQVLVVQVLTAGMERLLPDLQSWVASWVESATDMKMTETTLVIRRDVGARRLEGLPILEPEVVGSQSSLSAFPAWVRAAGGEGGLTFTLDLIGGQKTGFFFDQAANLETLLRGLHHSPIERLRPKDRPWRVVDLFCYVGQWSAQVAWGLKSSGLPIEAHLVDSSAPALRLAERNAKAAGARAVIHELDILEGLSTVPDGEVVICDPPAFIKSKKDHGAGLKGYLKANSMALNKVVPGGWFITCSCSHHLSEGEFIEILDQAERRADRKVRWLARGLQSPDHPFLMSFPEGRYLKCWIGRVE